MVIGIMLLCTVNALGELAVLYPVNGAFYNYAVRFLDPAWYALPVSKMPKNLGANVSKGFRYGLGLCHELAGDSTLRACRGQCDDQFLAR